MPSRATASTRPAGPASPASPASPAQKARPVRRTRSARAAQGAQAADAADAASWLQLDRQLCFALYAASLAMTRLYKPLLDPLSLTYPQYIVLLALWERDDATVGELGERLGLDSGTLTPLLKRLQAQGLLQRSRDAADERRVRVELTPQGQALKRRAQAVPRRIAAAAACPPADLAALTQRLQALRQQLLDASSALA